MATEPKKAKKQLGEISICADCWFGVFHFVSPLELGLKIALLSGRFDGLVDEHFKTRKWALGFLEICRLSTGKRPVISKKFGIDQLRIRRIPQAPLPDNIIGFESIRISYINRTVVEFLCRIRRLFDSTAGTNLYILTASGAPHVFQKKHGFQKKEYRKSTAMIRQHIWPLVQGTVRSLFLSAFIFDNLRQLSPSVLTDCCASLRTIDSFELFPVWPASDAKFSRGQAIAKWLITPCPDGAPKVLNCGCSSKQLIRLKEAFLNASSPANFILFMLCSSSFNTIWPFELINNLTGERMKMKQIGVKFHLVRCPIARDEKKWAEWEEAAIEWEWNEQWNSIVIGFNGSDGIGKDLL